MDAQRFYSSASWRAIRDAKMRRYPLCEACLYEGRTVKAVLVHHRDGNCFNNNASNLMSLCFSHHERTK